MVEERHASERGKKDHTRRDRLDRDRRAHLKDVFRYYPRHDAGLEARWFRAAA
jgi:hypothetical protein